MLCCNITLLDWFLDLEMGQAFLLHLGVILHTLLVIACLLMFASPEKAFVSCSSIPANQWIPSVGGCRQYCAAMVDVCPLSSFPQYGFKTLSDCEEVCPLYPVTGQDDAFFGDSFECRFNHLGYVVSQQRSAPRHCPHASADGGGTCVGGIELDQ